MTNIDLLVRLMIMLTIAALWHLLVGRWYYGNENQLPLNNHYRPAQSLFRLSLNRFRLALKNNCAKND
ncbi:MAG: hypothetical protein QS721_09185 [Candidatus Endonucleobacter sp. (ex Gigantidas childressi)]|nr:hypothetical protein [Candidatus Endonucleobacter sp. (ex Gigantidas childressi)]